MIGYIKKTGTYQEKIELEPTNEGIEFYTGKSIKSFFINPEFKNKGILSFINQNAKELDLEPNIFVVDDSSSIPCKEVIRGNCVFLKKCEEKFIDLSEDDITFIKEYISKTTMTDMQKAMIGLYDYDPTFVGQKFNKK